MVCGVEVLPQPGCQVQKGSNAHLEFTASHHGHDVWPGFAHYEFLDSTACQVNAYLHAIGTNYSG